MKNDLPIVNIALAADENYFSGLLATITSLLVSASKNHYYVIHILDGGISLR